MDRPAGRGAPMNEHLDEPIVIDVDPRLPGPEYGDPEESNELMDEAEESQTAAGSGSPAYVAPGELEGSSFEKTTRTRAYYTEDYKNSQVNKVVSSVVQVNEGRKRGQEDRCAMPSGGRPRWRSPSPGTAARSPESGPTGDARRRHGSQEPFCECQVCELYPECSRGAVVDPTESGRRRLRVVSTWTPEPRSRERSSTRPRSRLSSPA